MASGSSAYSTASSAYEGTIPATSVAPPMLGNIGTVELLLIMLAVLLVFGAKRIPEIAQGLGKGIREFRSAMRDISSELQIEEQQMRRATNLRQTAVRPTPPRQEAPFEPDHPTIDPAGISGTSSGTAHG